MSDSERERQLDDVVAAYLRARDAGQAPDRQHLLDTHPHLADDLRRFFAGEDGVEQVLAPPPAEAPARVPGYEMEGELGRGGMGVVYQARDRLGRTVALKVILAGAHAAGRDRGRFRTEAEAIARLNHPNIVQVYEAGEHDGLPYLALEYCGGGSLEARLRGGPLPPRDAAALVARLARAMHHAHARGLVHRDLKPANLLLTEDGTPKVSDFGLVKDLGSPGPTTSWLIVGTPEYMAPEQVGGRGGAVGPAADVYALGAVLYQCLTGRPPFAGPLRVDTVLQVLYDEPARPSRLRAGIPRDLETVCLKCLEKDPRQRYAGAAALAEDLERFGRGEAVVARPLGRVGRGWRWCRRNPVVASLTAAVLAALLAGTATAAAFAVRAGRAAREARAAEEDARGKKDEAMENARRAREETTRAEGLGYAGQLASARWAWDRGNAALAWQILNSTRPDFRGWEYRYLDTLFSSKGRVFHDTGPVFDVCFSPDGKRLISAAASFDADSRVRVRVRDLESGREVHAFTSNNPERSLVVLSRDGKRLAGDAGESSLRVWNLESGEAALAVGGYTGRSVDLDSLSTKDGVKAMLTLEGHKNPARSVCFSPDGKRLASGSEGSRTVRVWELEQGGETVVFDADTPAKELVFSPDGKRLAACLLFRDDGRVVMWELEGVKKILNISGPISHLCFSPDGKRLAGAVDDSGVKELKELKELKENVVRVWDAASGREALTLKGHTGPALSVCFSPDGKRLASGSEDRTVRVWDSESGQELVTFKGHTRAVTTVCFSPDGKCLASASCTTTGNLADVSADPTVCVWRLDRREAQQALAITPYDPSNNKVSFSRDAKRLAITRWGGHACVWDLEHGREMFADDSDFTSDCVSLSPDGKRLACGKHWAGGAGGKAVRVVDLESGREVLTYKGPAFEGVTDVCFSPDGKRLAVTGGSPSGTVWVWDLEDDQKSFTLTDDSMMQIASLSFSPDGRRLAGAKPGVNTMCVWDLESGRKTAFTLKGTDYREVSRANFSPDGKRLACANRGDSSIGVWDLENGTEVFTLRGHTNWVSCVSFSPDGKRLASASADRTVRVWDVERGQETLTLFGHETGALAVTFSPDGRRLTSTSPDGAVRVWSAEGWQE